VKAKIQTHGWLVIALLLAALAGRTTQAAWSQMHQLREAVKTTQTASFHVAEHVVERMNAFQQKLALSKSPEAIRGLEDEFHEIDALIASNKLMVTTSEQLHLLEEIDKAFSIYLHKAVTLSQAAQGGDAALASPISENLAKEAADVLALAESLRVSEQAALKHFIEKVEQSSAEMKQQLVYSALLTVILGIVAARSIYLAKVAPLRAELEESRVLLERKEKLASLGILSAGIAHEIRNPLAAIKIRLLGPKRALVRSPSEQEDLAVIDEEIRRLDRILTSFLQFARPEDPNMQSIVISALFQSVRNLLGPQLEQNGIELQVDCAETGLINGDSQQMQQVFVNLVLNAAESIEGSGSVTLRCRPIAGAPPLMLLQVVDTGKGIPPEVQKRLFDPFFTTKENGTGLGLAIAARIVEKHGGLLTYQTELEHGTTFTVELPCGQDRLGK
jgi:signal transduction histidine kinase